MQCKSCFKLSIALLLAVSIIREIASEPRWRYSRKRRRCRAKNCVPGQWNSWSSCSHSCGPHGVSRRSRSIRPASCGGTCYASAAQEKACNRFCMNGGTLIRSYCYCKSGYKGDCCNDVTGTWTSWGSWSHCSVTCGRGTQYRMRSCSKPGGVGCDGLAKEYRSCIERHCVADGGWSNWSSWGHCIGYCGSGIQTRKRSCTNPPPSYGGRKCSGPAEQHKNCLLQRCPVNGGWSAWLPWGRCSKTCGEGLQYTNRYCNNPKPQDGGRHCVGQNSDTRTCSVKSCTVDGGWSSWGKWYKCSKTCGTGSQYRLRTCTRPPPGYGGKRCVGSDKETRICNTRHCPADGGWSPWGKWCKCSKTCGTGSQYRKRTCTRPPPGYGGKRCVGSEKETRICNTRHCPADGGWSPWGKWYRCSKTCGTGSQYRKRTCTRPPPGYGGKSCVGSDKETRTCNTQRCAVDGGWSPWGKWYKCSKTCGTGSQYRTRTCTRPPPGYGGKRCVGSDKETRACNTRHCPIGGGWSDWTIWNKCSRTCGNGKQTSKRYCNNPVPKYGGRKCYGNDVRSRACNLKPCPVNGRWSKWATWSKCSKTCGYGSQTRFRNCSNPPPKYGGKCTGPSSQRKSCLAKKCPVNGRWSHWAAWSKCSKTCGNGTLTRLRTCTNPPPKYGGKCVGISMQKKPCIVMSCPVNGRWSNWQAWSECSKTCGNGTQIRLRTCTNPPPKYGGKCVGPNSQTKSCLVKSCTVDGRWSVWSLWSACSKTCGNGTKTRTRHCSNPPPQHGGKHCKGPSEQTKNCLNKCPVDGRWALWALWSACSKTCGNGTKTRTRSCSNPPPQYGGKHCKGPSEQSKNCLNKCPVDGRWALWSLWSACSKTCGNGTQTRSRSCSNPPPQHGGKHCKGHSEQTKDCQHRCPIDGRWALWSVWSACSETCGNSASKTRKRKCSNPPPQHGGRPCQGISVQTKSCQLPTCPPHVSWGPWNPWSLCSKTCGTGSQSRNRTCNGGIPGQGQCPGSDEETRNCNTQSCPVINGGWGQWSNWSSCSVSCGPGTRIRTRRCDSPPPGPGGRCIGLPLENKACDDGSCPGNCWSDWSDWSQCTKVCGCGRQFRVRFCKCAYGQGHAQCPGFGESSQSCNCNACPNGPPF
ncbi:A disintegrin and metalloproteinase with thrombospondin motifs adt-1-like isoform X2 [Montipora capricornis]|uniref:A disintegrin and metalloproteinase with thrombospondin motifs adt-1-like isoform X2 n=1 Tax=Montipora capricornis TaxID=246305 RepID=UPI0035F1E75A